MPYFSGFFLSGDGAGVDGNPLNCSVGRALLEEHVNWFHGSWLAETQSRLSTDVMLQVSLFLQQANWLKRSVGGTN